MQHTDTESSEENYHQESTKNQPLLAIRKQAFQQQAVPNHVHASNPLFFS
jgi:hypothetical protein